MRRLGLILLLAGGVAKGDAETDALLAELDAEVLRRNEGGRGGGDLAAEVLALRRRVADGTAGVIAGPEAHVVVVRDPDGDVRVRVTAVGGPIVLVVVGETAARWYVDREKGTDVPRVLAAGMFPVWVPGGTSLQRLDNVPPGFAGSTGMEAAIEERVRCGIATVLETDGREVVVVGPGNPEWVAQRARAEARRLLWRATRERRAHAREEMQEFRLGALRRWPGPAGKSGTTLRGAFAEWTPLGPLLAKEDPLPEPLAVATAAVKDDARREIYLLRHGVLLRYALPSGPPEVLRVPDTLPDIREPTSIAIDRRRDRLLLATSHDLGFLYAFDLESRKWSVINDLDGVDAAGMAYDEQRDAIFCIEYGAGNALRLQRFSSEGGQHLGEIRVRVPPPRERRPLAAACAGGRLAILYPPAATQLRADAEETRALVVEPHSGEILFSSATRAWEDFEPLDEIRLEEMWHLLLVREETLGLRAMRTLAGQGDRAVAFLERRLFPEPRAVEDLARLVAELADDDARVRDLALERLVEAGSKAAEFLAGIDSSDLPAEARRRIRAATEAVGASSSLQRALRAVKALEWTDSPAAEALLRRLATEGEPKRRAAATEALARMDRPRR